MGNLKGSKLKNAPLQEVIFEVRWDLQQENGQEYDEGFDLAQGKFASLIKNKLSFEHRKRTNPPIIPMELLAHKPIHQFWKSKNVWPVIQLGPGMLSVNDTDKNYDWEESFEKLINDALNLLVEAYEIDLHFNLANLRYVDAFVFKKTENTDIIKFLEDNLKTQVKRNFDIPGILDNLQLNERYALGDGTKINLTISNSQKQTSKVPALVWQTSVYRQDSFDIQALKKWANEAHKITSQLFKNMCSEGFYESFK